MSTKILLGFLIVALIAPTVFFARPQKAEALISLAQCFAAKAVAVATSAATAAPNAILSVSVSDISNTIVTGVGPAGTDWVSCFMKGLVKIIAKTLLHTFTQSIVNWINTGFQGSPSFVTNPEGFLNDVADQTVGRIIEDISPLLCSPFRLDIRFALGLNLSLRNRQEIHCRLSDVIANVRGAYDGFVTGTVGSGNLSRWIHIAGTQQNNPYGAYIAASYDIGFGITSATGQQVKLLDWGKGFKSWRSCKRWAPDVREGSPPRVTRKGACIEEGDIKTPGSIIQDQTTGALGTTLRELELANEIDEIVGALINQLLVKAITGAGGLLGASKGSITSGGRSAADSLSTDPRVALKDTDAVTPDGIDCRLRYYPATRETSLGSGIYVPEDTQNTVYTDNLGFGRTVGVAVGDNRAIVPAMFIREGESTPIAVEKGVETWKVYFDRVKAGCANMWSSLVTDAAGAGLSEYGRDTQVRECTDGVKPTDTKPCIEKQPPPTLPRITNRTITIPFDAVNQSHTEYISVPGYNQRAGPERALYGSSFSSTLGGTPPHWWTASLKPTIGSTEEIKIVKIRSRNYDIRDAHVDAVFLGNIGPAERKNGPIIPDEVTPVVYAYPPGDANAVVSGTPSDLTITFTVPVAANAISIISNTSPLILELVKLYGPVEAEDTAPTTTAPPPVSITLPAL